MNIRQYKEALIRRRDPYRAWIEEREEKFRAGAEPDNKISDDIKDSLRTEIHRLYRFFRLGKGVIDPEFYQRINAHLLQWRAEHKNNIPEVIYFDEDLCDFHGDFEEFSDKTPAKDRIKKRRSPYFKPGFAPDTLKEYYYIGGLTLVKWSLSERMEETEGASNTGSGFLRACALAAEGVLHIPEVLYHALSENDYSYPEQEGEPPKEKMTGASPEKSGSSRTDEIKETTDIIDVVILSKDHPELLKTCVSGLREAEKREGCLLTVTVVDNGSGDENREEYERLAKKYNFRYLFEPGPFHYSKQCNRGAEAEGNKYLLFLNDDVEISQNTRFLRKMTGFSAGLHVGAVGIKLLYPDGEHIQHAGISLLKTGPSHKLSGYSDRVSYYHGINRRAGNFLAVTGACLMVEREKFERVGGFDERFRIAYTDTDLCLKLYEAGYNSVCLNSVYLIHHESFSRGDDLNDRGGFERLCRERDLFNELHGETFKKGDPFYSPLLTDTGLDYRVNYPLPEEEIRCEENLVPFSGEGCFLKSAGGRFQYSLDSDAYHFSDAVGNEDFYELRGWAFISGKPGYLYEVLVLLKDRETKEVFRLPSARVLREDLSGVFPKEKGIALNGFVSKVSRRTLKEGAEYEVSIALVRPGFFGGFRGEIRENICQICRNGALRTITEDSTKKN